MSDWESQRKETQAIFKDLSIIRRCDGHEKFVQAFERRVGSTGGESDPSLRLNIYAGFAVDLDYAVRNAPEDTSPLSLDVRTPLDRDGYQTFIDTLNGSLDYLTPTPRFCKAVGTTAVTCNILRTPDPDALEEDGKTAAGWAAERGRRVMAEQSSRLYPIATAILQRSDVVTDLDASRGASGSRLLYRLAVSLDRQNKFGQTVQDFYKKKGVLLQPAEAAHPLYDASAEELAEHFKDMFEVTTVGGGDGPRVVWKDSAPVDVGCPITFMFRKTFRPTWEQTGNTIQAAGLLTHPAA